MRLPLLLPVTAVTVGLAASPTAATCQTTEVELPEGWHVRTDRPEQDPADVAFMDMPPGWHVTTGPAAILWNPDRTASGEFRVEMEVFLFDPRGRREGFGILLGGADLDGPGQAYVYFLLREGGEFLVKRRDGDETETLVGWRAAPGMASWADRPEDQTTARNLLAVEAGREEVRFFVNGQEVGALPRGEIDVEGIVGIRVNHALDLHVSRLEVEAR